MPFRLRLWLDRAFALAKVIEQRTAATIQTKRRQLERDLEAILRTPGSCPMAAS